MFNSSYSCHYFRFQPRVVSDTDEIELAKQLQQLEDQNREVAGDSDDDEEVEGMGEVKGMGSDEEGEEDWGGGGHLGFSIQGVGWEGYHDCDEIVDEAAFGLDWGSHCNEAGMLYWKTQLQCLFEENLSQVKRWFVWIHNAIYKSWLPVYCVMLKIQNVCVKHDKRIILMNLQRFKSSL